MFGLLLADMQLAELVPESGMAETIVVEPLTAVCVSNSGTKSALNCLCCKDWESVLLSARLNCSNELLSLIPFGSPEAGVSASSNIWQGLERDIGERSSRLFALTEVAANRFVAVLEMGIVQPLPLPPPVREFLRELRAVIASTPPGRKCSKLR